MCHGGQRILGWRDEGVKRGTAGTMKNGPRLREGRSHAGGAWRAAPLQFTCWVTDPEDPAYVVTLEV